MAEEMLVLAGSAEELGGVFLVCTVVASLSVISMVIFACGSSDSKNKRPPEVRAAGTGAGGGGRRGKSRENFLEGVNYGEGRDVGEGGGAHHHSGGGGGHHGGGGGGHHGGGDHHGGGGCGGGGMS